jgi:hypothetical protein
VIRLFTGIREVLGSNLVWDTGCPDLNTKDVFMWYVIRAIVHLRE